MAGAGIVGSAQSEAHYTRLRELSRRTIGDLALLCIAELENKGLLRKEMKGTPADPTDRRTFSLNALVRPGIVQPTVSPAVVPGYKDLRVGDMAVSRYRRQYWNRYARAFITLPPFGAVPHQELSIGFRHTTQPPENYCSLIRTEVDLPAIISTLGFADLSLGFDYTFPEQRDRHGPANQADELAIASLVKTGVEMLTGRPINGEPLNALFGAFRILDPEHPNYDPDRPLYLQNNLPGLHLIPMAA